MAKKKSDDDKPKKRKSRARKTDEDETKKRKSRASKAKTEEKSKETKSKKKTKKKSKKKDGPRIPPEVNIGTAGHVDEGKSTLIQLLTGKFPDEHSEELRRGITIRLGYADCDIMKCPDCDEPEMWTIEDECPNCGNETKIERRVSFVDAPGHEILMSVMLSGAALMDGVMLIIAANNEVPQPQTREHLAALTALGVDKIVIVQNKIDLVTKKQAEKNYKDIKKFVQGTIAENAPVIPISAMHGANLDVLLSALQKFIPTPERDLDAPLQMMVARSFDINRPGTKAKKLKGGVVGGSLTQGKVKVGDEVVIVPGLKRRSGGETNYIPVKTTVESIQVGSLGMFDEATPGGLLALQTRLDPSMARSDNLGGNVVSSVEAAPPVITSLTLETHLFDEVVGSERREEVKPISPDENILLTVGTATAVGTVRTIAKKGRTVFDIKPPVAMNPDSKIALSRRFMKRWRLIGYGEVHDYESKELVFQEEDN